MFVVEPVWGRLTSIGKQIENKTLFLDKYSEILRRRAYYVQKQKDTQEQGALLVKQFFPEDQPALAAASLQKIIEEKAREAGVAINTTRVDKSKYMERLMAVPVEINVQAALRNLTQLMYLIENHEKLLVIEEINIQKGSKKDNELEELRAKLVVTGFVKSLEPEKAKKAS